MKQSAAIDASFWINTYEVNLSSFLTDYFDLYICQVVVDEIMYPVRVLDLDSPTARLLRQWLERGQITL